MRLALPLLLPLAACTTVPAYTELGRQAPLANVADALIACPAGVPNVSGAQRYRDLVLDLPEPSRSVATGAYVPPRLLSPPVARFPKAEFEAGKSGHVIVQVVVDPSGRVSRAEPVCSSGGGFETSAITAARALRYQPASLDGRRIWDTALQPFAFVSR